MYSDDEFIRDDESIISIGSQDTMDESVILTLPHKPKKLKRLVKKTKYISDTEDESEDEVIRTVKRKRKNIIESDSEESDSELRSQYNSDSDSESDNDDSVEVYDNNDNEYEYVSKITCNICKRKRDKESFSSRELKSTKRCLYCTQAVSNNAYYQYQNGGYHYKLSRDKIAENSKKLEKKSKYIYQDNSFKKYIKSL
jgi:hypothetical protein